MEPAKNKTIETGTTARHTEDAGVQSRPFGPRFVTPMFMGSALNPINSSVIATALVSIAAAMGVSVGQTSILISSLYLTSAIAQPTAGRLAEEFGPRRVFLAGILIVLLGGILGGVGQNLPTLVVARVLLGLGTSAGYPSAMLLIRRRATAIGLQTPPGNVLGGLAIAGAATVAIGPTIGGLLVGWFNWRAAFFVNIPVAGAAFVMALLWIAKDQNHLHGRSVREVITRIDLLGVIGFGGAMTALLVFLLSLPSPDWISLGASITVAVALVCWELRATNPFLDVRLLASNLPLTRTYIRYGLTLLGVYVTLYGLTQWIEVARGLSAYQAGLILIPMGVLSAVAARAVSHHHAVHLPLIASALFMLAGAVATLFLTSHSPVIAIIAITGLFGLMSGSSNVTNQTALYKQAPAETVGTASGLLRTFGYIGSIAASTITGVAFHARVDDSGLHHVSLIMIGIGIVVLLMTVFDRHLSRSDRGHPGHDPRRRSRLPNLRRPKSTRPVTNVEQDHAPAKHRAAESLSCATAWSATDPVARQGTRPAGTSLAASALIGCSGSLGRREYVASAPNSRRRTDPAWSILGRRPAILLSGYLRTARRVRWTTQGSTGAGEGRILIPPFAATSGRRAGASLPDIADFLNETTS